MGVVGETSIHEPIARVLIRDDGKLLLGTLLKEGVLNPNHLYEICVTMGEIELVDLGSASLGWCGVNWGNDVSTLLSVGGREIFMTGAEQILDRAEKERRSR